MEQMTWHGAYGVVLHDSKILLTKKKSGPHKGLWGLPGGKIEFGETPETALKRELLEESCIDAGKLEFLEIATAVCEYVVNDSTVGFHQVGIIYRVLNVGFRSDLKPEEENRWILLNEIDIDTLTPFAKQIIAKLPKDKTWRPKPHIRGKVIALAKQENRVLVCEVRDDHGALKGWCPLGGGIDFAESAENAVKREIYEETGSNVEILGKPFVCENIYDHHGFKGHEIVFIFPVRFNNSEMYSRTRFQITEDNGSTHWAEWIEIERFVNGELILFPEILVETLKM